MDFVRSLRPMTEQGAIGVLRSLLFSYREMHNKIRDLSGGEKSRLQIARLMLTDANFLVLDEPTNNLDIASIEVLGSRPWMNLMGRYWQYRTTATSWTG